jgi:hypothetical protein
VRCTRAILYETAVVILGARRFRRRRDMLSLGRAGAGVDVEIDDPLLAYRHATLKRQKDGTWLITAEPTRNGVWVSASTVALTSNCRFRCGEQQFWFVIP